MYIYIYIYTYRYTLKNAQGGASGAARPAISNPEPSGCSPSSSSSETAVTYTVPLVQGSGFRVQGAGCRV